MYTLISHTTVHSHNGVQFANIKSFIILCPSMICATN